MSTDLLGKELTEKVIGACYKVHNTLGQGFLERVYENALYVELRNQGIDVRQQVPIKVRYESVEVGEFFADLLVNDSLIVELKATQGISKSHEMQLINYLKATGITLGLLVNFGNRCEIRRKINT